MAGGSIMYEESLSNWWNLAFPTQMRDACVSRLIVYHVVMDGRQVPRADRNGIPLVPLDL